MKIIVLIKQVPDTADDRKLDLATGLIERNAGENVVDEVNERALEVALRFKDFDERTEVVVLSLGPHEASQALRRALSIGADSAVHVCDDALAGADAVRTSMALAAALSKTGFDLVIAGNESTDGRTGAVPAMVAEYLEIPLLGSVEAVEISENIVRGQRHADGVDSWVHAKLPAVITITERSAEVRFPSFKGILTGKRKPVTSLSLADLGVIKADQAGVGRCVVLSTTARPERAAGRKIVDEGTAAAELADFLIAGRLV
ncbi:electron transfer flavoprotein subunit beta/FixA family protein [Arthrobacter sp. efr-133-TYG-120]|uniref:electron transfer flavoprotein subunit beta/FixA family protein n=1 Tax=Arthrobacter sp. efr-133-TYG-120 TaxID=3040280 RepID=UPI00254DD834|nr:electron transfer flavoprotein subunit beta/FixA family protein [Arthrobacter sp. efr-133-TYG-120]